MAKNVKGFSFFGVLCGVLFLSPGFSLVFV